MVRGIGKTKVKKKPWKTRVERDIKFSLINKWLMKQGFRGVVLGRIFVDVFYRYSL